MIESADHYGRPGEVRGVVLGGYFLQKSRQPNTVELTPEAGVRAMRPLTWFAAV